MNSVPRVAIIESMRSGYKTEPFKRFRKPTHQKRGRSPLYNSDALLRPLKRIWLASNLPCSKRLKVIIPLWLAGYCQQYGDLPPDIIQSLLRISPATIDRLFNPIRIHYTGNEGGLLPNREPS